MMSDIRFYEDWDRNWFLIQFTINGVTYWLLMSSVYYPDVGEGVIFFSRVDEDNIIHYFNNPHINNPYIEYYCPDFDDLFINYFTKEIFENIKSLYVLSGYGIVVDYLKNVFRVQWIEDYSIMYF